MKKINLLMLLLIFHVVAYAQNLLPNESRTSTTIRLSQKHTVNQENIVFNQKGALLKSKTQKGSFTTTAIKIDLNNPTPFISSYTTWIGEELHHELLKIEQRISIDGNTWADWEETKFDGHVNVDNHQEAKRLTSVASFLPKDTRFIQYRISWTNTEEITTKINNVEVSFYSPGDTPNEMIEAAQTQRRLHKTEAGCSQPPVVLRSQWGARAPKSSYSYTSITHLVVHHAYGYDWNDGAAAVRAIQDLHQNSNGWSDIGYNYLIHKSGTIYQGRPEDVVGAHFCGYNNKTMGICMLGTFSTGTPTAAAMQSLKELLAWKANKEGISPTGSSYHYSTGGNVKNIAGHRDGGGCSTCPGDGLYAVLPNVRNDVAALIQNGCNGGGSTDTTAPVASISAPSTVSNDFTATFTDTDNVGINDRFYQVLEWRTNEWRGNRGNGFYNDNFDNSSLHADYQQGLDDWQGTWWETTDGRLRQSSTSHTNTALSTFFSQTNGNKYLYHFAAKVNNTSGNRRFGLHIMASSITERERGNSYLVWFSTDQNKVIIYETIDNALYSRAEAVLSTNNDWADYKITYSTNYGKIEVYKNNLLVASWTDASPLTSGSYVSFRTNGASVDFDDFKIYKARGASQVITVGSQSSHDIRVTGSPAAKIKSLCKDTSNNWSDLANKDINVSTLSAKIDVREHKEIKDQVLLYPNPIEGNSLTIQLELIQASKIDIRLYNLLGEEIAVLYQNQQQEGLFQQEFDMSNYRLLQGTYLLKISTNTQLQTLKFVKL